MELVNLPVDVIVTDGGPAVARVAMAATSQIPIVMGTVGLDPCRSVWSPAFRIAAETSQALS
jgi:hypothetical protein